MYTPYKFVNTLRGFVCDDNCFEDGKTSLSKDNFSISTICMLAIFVDLRTFANSLDPDEAQQNVGLDLDPKCLTL